MLNKKANSFPIINRFKIFFRVHFGMHMPAARWPANLCCGAISCPVSQFNYKPRPSGDIGEIYAKNMD